MQIGDRLKQYRKAKGYSIYKLSLLTDISQNHISAIENNKRQATVDTLQRLIAPLGISLSELFNTDSEISYLTETERTLLENYRTMTDENAELFLKLSNSLSNK